jgi:diaminohydroxyphosphoribosylaminopyrimidine deaminase/5-amino-6-(5-phosphoribosylamino)uracil reductase
LKWAETANGFIDINRHNSVTKALKISNSASSRWVHKLRSETDAILIGKNTAFLDNPSLTTRNWFGKNPVRIVIDKKLELPNNLKLWDKSVSTLVYNSLKANKEINLELIKIDFENFIPSLLKDLWERNIQSILIEGGRFTLQEFIDQQIWDDLFVIKSSNQIENGVNAPTTNSNLLHSHSVDTDLIQHYELSL